MINEKYTVFFIFIMLVCILIFKFIDININLICGVVVGAVCIYFAYNYFEKENYENENDKQLQIEAIRPKTKELHKYDDLREFIFSVQDMYPYNPPSFESVIDSIDAFLVVYNHAISIPKDAGSSYTLADKLREQIIFDFHSIIYQLPDSHEYIDIFNSKLDELEDIINRYLSTILRTNRFYNRDNGLNINSKIIYDGPKENNYYDPNGYK